MNLKSKKRIAAKILKCSPKRVKLDPSRDDEIKESVTKADLRSLIKDKAIKKEKVRCSQIKRRFGCLRDP